MRLDVRFITPLTVSAPGIEIELRHVALQLQSVATMLGQIAAAQNRIADAQEAETHPTKATTVSLADIQAEPLVGPPPEVLMSQFKIGLEGCKAKLIFNGKIDGEPTLTVTGSSATMIQDNKVEVPTPSDTDPGHFVDTEVTLHFKNDGSLPAGIFGVSGFATADDPETSEEEKVIVDFPEVGEYIPQTQAKANSVSLATEIEPL